MTSGDGRGDAIVVRQHIHAPPERVFGVWTSPEHLVRWWGPAETRCLEAHIDLRIGGRFRIANQLPTGDVVWVSGRYEEIDRPNRLRHTWLVEGAPDGGPSRVTVTFAPSDGGTDVIVEHDQVADPAIRASHAQGWRGCLDGLAAFPWPGRDAPGS